MFLRKTGIFGFLWIALFLFFGCGGTTGKANYWKTDKILTEGKEECNRLWGIAPEEKERCRESWEEELKAIEQDYKDKKYSQDKWFCSNPKVDYNCLNKKQEIFYSGALSNFLNRFSR